MNTECSVRNYPGNWEIGYLFFLNYVKNLYCKLIVISWVFVFNVLKDRERHTQRQGGERQTHLDIQEFY